MMGHGICVVLSGFSGTGKGTVIRRLLEKYPERYALSVSCTSRPKREGERDGIDYFFHTNEEFEEMIREGKFLEFARYVDHYYGTPADYVNEQLAAGKDLILEIETQGALQVKENLKEAVLIFLMPPSAKELERRLRNRGTESEEVIRARLDKAVSEADEIEKYDYVVVNDDLETCVEEMHRLIQSAHASVASNLAWICGMKKELSKYRLDQR